MPETNPDAVVVRKVQNRYADEAANVDLTGLFVQEINGIAPDENGSVTLDIGGGGGGSIDSYVKTVNGIGPDINGNVNVQVSGGNNPIGGGGGGGGGIHSLQRHGKRLKLWHEYVNVDQYGDWEAVYKPANFEEVIAVFAHGSALTEEPKNHSAKGRTHPHYNDKVKVTVLGY